MTDVINNSVPTPVMVYGRAPNGQLQAVTTDGSGNISFAGAGGTPGGLSTQVQYNSGGTTFAGTANLTVVAGVLTLPSHLETTSGATIGVTGGPSITFGSASNLVIATYGGNFIAFSNAFQMGEINSPGGSAGNTVLFPDLTTHTFNYNSNNNGVASFSGAWVNTNISPVTVSANVNTAQNLMSASIPAGTLNRVGRSLRVWLAGVYSTPASSTSTITVAITLGGVTLLTITTAALGSITATNDQFNVSAVLSVQTAGSSGVFESHGNLAIGLGAGNSVADTIYTDTNTAVSSAVNLTTAETLQVTITFSNASASNSATQRQMVLETIG
jgi:hypothetical protein